MTSFWQNYFCTYFPKYQHIEENDVFWDHFEKIHFCSYQLSTFREKEHCFKITIRNFFAHISKNINISTKTMFLESKNINISKRATFLLRSFLKIVYCPNIQKYQHIDEIEVFSYHFEKILFCPYLRKYQHIEKSEFILRSFWKKPFFVHISKNINISTKTTFFETILKKISFCSYLRKYYQYIISSSLSSFFESIQKSSSVH